MWSAAGSESGKTPDGEGRGVSCEHGAPASGACREGEVGGFCLPLQEAVGALHNIAHPLHRGRTARAHVFGVFF